MSGALILPILFYLVGHFLARSLTRKGDGWAELALLRVAASGAVACPLLTLLALVGRFTVPAIAASLGVCVVVAWALTYGASGAVRFAWWYLCVLGLVADGFALYARRRST